MNLKTIGQIVGVVALTVGLAGCMDVTMDVEIQSDTNGKVTTTSVMGADFYAMAKAGMGAAEGGDAAAKPAEDGFCQEEGATLTENADGSATCVMVVEGTFAELKTGEGNDGAKFEVVSPGVVKVSFSTEDMKGELGTEGQDEETKAMMQAFFEGHAITIRIIGKEIVETNMTKSADGKSAEIIIPFLDLINGTVELPPELSATVKTN
jgi:hypothetical protein